MTVAPVAPRAGIPAAAWTHRIGETVPSGGPRTREPLIDDGPTGGVPIGGIGSGSIGRTCDGDFARWHLRVGTHRFAPSADCRFSFSVDGVPIPIEGTYRALFPRAWIQHDLAAGVRLTQRQLSPVLPHNYRESSYPVGVFRWSAENTTSEVRRIEVGLTWRAQDEDGVTPPEADVRVERDGELVGVVLDNGRDERGAARGQFAIVALGGDGIRASARAGSAATGEVTLSVDLAPGGSRTLDLALAWDFPLMRFGSGRAWYRRYTRSFGREGTHAWEIASEGLRRQDEWERVILDWQTPLLDDPARPAAYTMALFNELYFLVDGGTAWEDGMEGAPPPADGTGRFAILECFDYPYYNTHDVLFYASWALAQLWPLLELRALRSFAATVDASDASLVKVEATGGQAIRKERGAVAHDVGAPSEDPWMLVNAYRFQDPNRWKDLASKLALQLWRDVVLLGARDVLAEAWPSVKAAIDRLTASDTDGDGLPDHDGGADQTFDNWPMTGPSAYAGGLWVSALAAAERMAGMLGDEPARRRYGEMYARGASSLTERLWNGHYLRYDGSDGPSSDSVMADQLCGLWWADAAGLPSYLVDDDARVALETVFRLNVRGFASGRFGAVNGMRPDGSVDRSSEQSQEVWPGVTYTLAAMLLSRGLDAEAWETALGAVRTTYEQGFQFRTPEAWDEEGNFRASLYMRPLAIWAIEHALAMRERRKAPI